MSTIPPNMPVSTPFPFSNLRVQTKCAVDSRSESSSRPTSPLLPSSPAAMQAGHKAVSVAPPAAKNLTSIDSAPRTGARLVRAGLLIGGLVLMAVGIGVAVGTSGIGLPLGSIMAIVGAGLVLSAISRSTRSAPQVAEVKLVGVPALSIAQKSYKGRTFSDPQKVSAEQQFRQYVEGTRTMGVWGDHLEIPGLVSEVSANIRIFSTHHPESPPKLHKFKSTDARSPFQETPTLELNYDGSHYTVKQGLEEMPIKGDGDCLYRAAWVARNLYNYNLINPSRAELHSVQPSAQELQRLRHRIADRLERSNSDDPTMLKQDLVQIEAREVFARRHRARSL